MKQTYTLLYPIKYADREIFELEVEKPKPKILKKYNMANLSMSDMIKIAAECVGEAPSVVESLELDDYMGVVNILEDWFRVAAERR